MPTDPKFRTIARLSGEPISLVIAMYMHMLVDGSRNVTRGHVTVTPEDLASALDVTEVQIQAVIHSMEGRLLDKGYLSGWEKRQVKREDTGNEETGAKSPAQRKAEQRQREKEARELAEKQKQSQAVTQSHDASRSVTTDKDKEGDKDKESGGERTPAAAVDNSDHPPQISDEFRKVLNARPDLDPENVWANFWSHYPPEKRTLPRWAKWVQSEHTGQAATPANDPDTKANVQALAATKGVQPWDELTETWAVYKDRVRAAPTLKPPPNRNKWMETLAVKKGVANAA
jgi:hypothetical protein